MALTPIHGRAVCARSPSKRARATSTPWHPASTQPSVGSSSTANSPASSSGRVPNTVPSPLNSVGHLLAFVEREGDVVAGRRGVGVQGLGQAQQHREAALHVGGTEAVEHVAVDPRTSLPWLAGTVSRWPPSTTRRSRPSTGAGDHVGADPVDGEARGALAQPGLHQVGELGLVVALRAHRRPARW